MSTDAGVDVDRARALVAAVPDPEVPVLTIEDLGVLRGVSVGPDGTVEVVLTPTYSGCPAMETIKADVERTLYDNGYGSVRIRMVLSPAWTTDWMSEAGKRKLVEYGVAPPTGRGRAGPVPVPLAVRCPRCGSLETRQLSRFGSTACKALWQCRSCAEPFDHFKAI